MRHLLTMIVGALTLVAMMISLVRGVDDGTLTTCQFRAVVMEPGAVPSSVWHCP